MKKTFYFRVNMLESGEVSGNILVVPEDTIGLNVKYEETLLGIIKEAHLTDEGYLAIQVDIKDQELWEDLRAQVDMAIIVKK
jgi:hypothetical protein